MALSYAPIGQGPPALRADMRLMPGSEVRPEIAPGRCTPRRATTTTPCCCRAAAPLLISATR